MLPLWHAFVLGAIEGITEYLPISSTAHMVLASHLMHIDHSEFVKNFEIIIQLGSILAVLGLFWKKIFNIEMIKKLIVAFIPTGIIGLIVYKFLKEYLLDNVPVILAALLIGGIIMIIYERKRTPNPNEELELEKITYGQAFKIGLFQSIAIIPGVSRSAATIIGGSTLGINRKTIVEFSFLLAVPTMLAATGLDLLKSYKTFNSGEITFLTTGFIVSLVTAIFAVKFLLNYIKKHDFKTFGIYRIILAIVFFFVK